MIDMQQVTKFFVWVPAAVLLPLLLRFLYGLLLQDKEVQLKGFLAKRRSERSHQRKVSEFVGVFKGRVSADNTRLSSYVVLAWGLVASWLLTWAGLYVSSTIESAKASIAMVEQRMVERAKPDSKAPPTPEENFEREIPRLKIKLSQLENVGLPFTLILSALVWISLFFGLWSWLPRRARLSYFEFEIQRFLRHMHTLANESERVLLVLAEIGAQDEDGLKEFVRVAYRVASKHSASVLVRKFDLWNMTDLPDT